jgi:hypothetical protein
MFWWYLNKETVYNIGYGILCIIFLPVILVFGLIDDVYRENARDKGYPGNSQTDDFSVIRIWNKERKQKLKEEKKAEKEKRKRWKQIAFEDFCNSRNSEQ